MLTDTAILASVTALNKEAEHDSPALVLEEASQDLQKSSSCPGLLLEALDGAELAKLHVTQ